VFLNSAPVLWYSRKQKRERHLLLAIKTGMELSDGLRYKLSMMGMSLNGHTHIKADNMFVVKNTSVPESMLKKKSNSITYHFYVREQAVAGMVSITHEPNETNIADMVTKIQPGPTRKKLAKMVLFYPGGLVFQVTHSRRCAFPCAQTVGKWS
jgi:hypothetical protein